MLPGVFAFQWVPGLFGFHRSTGSVRVCSGSIVSTFLALICSDQLQDIAFLVARFIQNRGSFVNYYMYYGGTNFGRASGRFITMSYDYDAPIDEYGMQ
ncbi:hypothetical protein RIF29_34642 [Crotalaria pallida]|uniref:beta-galactosidase n=1 Tax=Crotalaria pallida TaxID=3830 RepID=A0AAN9EEW4_CROPI